MNILVNINAKLGAHAIASGRIQPRSTWEEGGMVGNLMTTTLLMSITDPSWKPINNCEDSMTNCGRCSLDQKPQRCCKLTSPNDRTALDVTNATVVTSIGVHNAVRSLGLVDLSLGTQKSHNKVTCQHKTMCDKLGLATWAGTAFCDKLAYEMTRLHKPTCHRKQCQPRPSLSHIALFVSKFQGWPSLSHAQSHIFMGEVTLGSVLLGFISQWCAAPTPPKPRTTKLYLLFICLLMVTSSTHVDYCVTDSAVMKVLCTEGRISIQNN